MRACKKETAERCFSLFKEFREKMDETAHGRGVGNELTLNEKKCWCSLHRLNRRTGVSC